MSRQNKRSQPINQRSNQLRIIAGQWRGRKLTFPSLEGLRPSPDRVRETLFNWLTPEIEGAHCLDLFCGSGALGLEALSRGASRVDMIDHAAPAIEQVRANMALLGTDTSQAIHDNAINWLERRDHSRLYDILFLDPPFRTGLAASVIATLTSNALLKPYAWVYLEMGTDEALPKLPSHWQLHREKLAGRVRSQLYRLVASAAT